MKEIDFPGFFRLARSVSRNSNHRVPMGAVLVKKGKPISVGFNKDKTRPGSEYSIHAEVEAIRKTGKMFIKNCSIYVWRENSEGYPAMARPCELCMKILKTFGVKKIYYSTDLFPYWGREILK